MSTMMDEEIKRWTARRKSALVLEIIQGKSTVAEVAKKHGICEQTLYTWRKQYGELEPTDVKQLRRLQQGSQDAHTLPDRITEPVN